MSRGSGLGVDVHITGLRCPADDLPRLEEGLDPHERGRAARLAPARRRRFVVARSALRRILAPYLGVAPSAVALVVEDGGRPVLAGRGGPTVGFSLSHSDDLLLVGVVRGGRVGVDVERVRRGVWSRPLAERTFSEEELRLVPAGPGPRQEAALFAAWTRKEAYLKAVGRGLADDLAEVSVVPAALAAQGWTVRDVRISDHAATVVARPEGEGRA
jgi:4'-phosphopantetheinyl transferase